MYIKGIKHMNTDREKSQQGKIRKYRHKRKNYIQHLYNIFALLKCCVEY